MREPLFLELDTSDIELLINSGDIEDARAYLQPIAYYGANTIQDANITYSSSDNSIAEVDGGVITAKIAGEATITVTLNYGALQTSKDINVTVANLITYATPEQITNSNGVVVNLKEDTAFHFNEPVSFNGKGRTELISLESLPKVIGEVDARALHIMLTDTHDTSNRITIILRQDWDAKTTRIKITALHSEVLPSYRNNDGGLTYVANGSNDGSYGVNHYDNTLASFTGEYLTDDIRNQALFVDFSDTKMELYLRNDTTSRVAIDFINGFPDSPFAFNENNSAKTFHVSVYADEYHKETAGFVVDRIAGQTVTPGNSHVKATTGLDRLPFYGQTNIRIPYFQASNALYDTGTLIELKEGEVMTYNKVIDFTGKTDALSFLVMNIMPYTQNIKDVGRLYIKLTDADPNNSDNYVIIATNHSPDSGNMANTGYARASFGTYKPAGWISDTDLRNDDKYGRTMPYASFFGVLRNSLDFALKFDYTTKILYNKDGLKIIDLTQDFETAWGGFTNGKAILSIYGGDYNTSRMRILVGNIYGERMLPGLVSIDKAE